MLFSSKLRTKTIFDISHERRPVENKFMRELGALSQVGANFSIKRAVRVKLQPV